MDEETCFKNLQGMYPPKDYRYRYETVSTNYNINSKYVYQHAESKQYWQKKTQTQPNCTMRSVFNHFSP